MHLRRALLLFAIVLGLAAIAASLSRPRDTDEAPQVRTPPSTTEAERPPTAAPGNATPEQASPAEAEVTFVASDPHPQKVAAGQAATVYVEVMEPGQVEIANLGMSADAEPHTPARFDVFTRTTGRYPITFVPASAEDTDARIGTLVVR